MSETRSKRVKAQPISRYDGGYDAYIPGNLGRPPASANVRTAVGAVQDPMEPGKRIHATINRRVDVLEIERSHKRITEAAYMTGRVAQAIFERTGHAPDRDRDPAGDRSKLEYVRDLPMILAIDDARTVAAYEKWIVSVLGHMDSRILRYVIRDGRTFAQLAEDRGRGGRQGTSYYADRFRDALETLAHALAARGKERVAMRGERNAPVPGEEYDRNGILLPEGETGYRVANDLDKLATLRAEQMASDHGGNDE